ncbi:hypothetical protein D3C73_1303920 [compost metagenome]
MVAVRGRPEYHLCGQGFRITAAQCRQLGFRTGIEGFPSPQCCVVGNAVGVAHAVHVVQVSQLAKATKLPVEQTAGLEDSGPQTVAGEHDHKVVDSLRTALPPFSEGREIGIVFQEHMPTMAFGHDPADIEGFPEFLGSEDLAVPADRGSYASRHG